MLSQFRNLSFVATANGVAGHVSNCIRMSFRMVAYKLPQMNILTLSAVFSSHEGLLAQVRENTLGCDSLIDGLVIRNA
jgi:hypothetical protein